MTSQGWKATAAYLYVLHLGVAGLAWEYLRRNPVYQREWDEGRLLALGTQRWGLQFR